MNKINLICLPFAGANKYSYNIFKKLVHESIELISIEIPGRGSRVQESLLSDMESIIEDVFNQVKHLLETPYALYGHSMGSKIGYLLTQKLIREGLPLPIHLFFTGSAGPFIKKESRQYHSLPNPEFVEEIRKMGGSPEEVLANEDMLSFFLPILRADFMAIETHPFVKNNVFDIPITVMTGLEEDITLKEAIAWKLETAVTFTYKQFPGNHFFIFEYPKQIMQTICQTLDLLLFTRPIKGGASGVLKLDRNGGCHYFIGG